MHPVRILTVLNVSKNGRSIIIIAQNAASSLWMFLNSVLLRSKVLTKRNSNVSSALKYSIMRRKESMPKIANLGYFVLLAVVKRCPNQKIPSISIYHNARKSCRFALVVPSECQKSFSYLKLQFVQINTQFLKHSLMLWLHSMSMW